MRHYRKKRGGTQGEAAIRPVMTITIHIGYTEGSLNRELPLPGGPEVGTSTPRKWRSHGWPMLFWGTVVGYVMLCSACQAESDHIGLILMAKAGYDPREAIGLWERMEAGQHGVGPPEFLSTHPSGATRIKQI